MVGICILNYNMPEATDDLASVIIEEVEVPFRLHVIDNGSDLVPMAEHTTLRIPQNVQTTGGWLSYLGHVKDVDYVWLLITSCVLDHKGRCPLTPMVQFMDRNPNAVAIHPALTRRSTTSWKHLKTRGGYQPRQTWMIDNIAPLYRFDWLQEHLFDPELIYAWGIDLETCYKARMEGRSLWVHEETRITKVTDVGYSMGRMNMTADQRRQLASDNMESVLLRKYGPDWWSIMLNEGVEDWMR